MLNTVDCSGTQGGRPPVPAQASRVDHGRDHACGKLPDLVLVTHHLPSHSRLPRSQHVWMYHDSSQCSRVAKLAHSLHTCPFIPFIPAQAMPPSLHPDSLPRRSYPGWRCTRSARPHRPRCCSCCAPAAPAARSAPWCRFAGKCCFHAPALVYVCMHDCCGRDDGRGGGHDLACPQGNRVHAGGARWRLLGVCRGERIDGRACSTCQQQSHLCWVLTCLRLQVCADRIL